MTKIVIIGAGLTGLSTAYHLEKRKFFDYQIFEKETSLGGLCRTVTQDGFTFDFTGHLLHISDVYFRTLLEQTVGMELFNTVARRSFIYSHDTYTHYPFQINLHGLPEQVIIDCITGFVNRAPSRYKPHTFKQWVLRNFGAGFGRHFFFPYQKKIFAYDIRKISASWTGRFVPSTSLDHIIRGVLKKQPLNDVGYNAQFLYPKQGGIIAWVNTFARNITLPIYTDFCVQSVDIHQKVVLFTNGHVEPYDILINTMPLDCLLHTIKEKPSTFLKRALPHLVCNSVINFNVGVAHPNLSDKHWIYFPEVHYPFYRLGFPHNCSTAMTPPNCSSLYGEFAYINKSAHWRNQTLNHALQATKKLLNIHESDIITEKIITIPHAYVIYNFWRERNLPKLLTCLQEHGIYSTGRYGEWKYSSMQEAVLDGKKIAEILTIIPAKQPPKHPSIRQTIKQPYKELSDE